MIIMKPFNHYNPCDIKVKTNRFQIFGHTLIEILFQDEGPQGLSV
jgi:hypothetical protein